MLKDRTFRTKKTWRPKFIWKRVMVVVAKEEPRRENSVVEHAALQVTTQEPAKKISDRVRWGGKRMALYGPTSQFDRSIREFLFDRKDVDVTHHEYVHGKDD